MKIKKWISDNIGFSPILLAGVIGWILDVLNMEIWVIYWFLGFLGVFLSGALFHYVDKHVEEGKDEENKEDEEDNK